ncbi:hypothetical protein EJB05_54565, partial [Eragrostis curvula]
MGSSDRDEGRIEEGDREKVGRPRRSTPNLHQINPSQLPHGKAEKKRKAQEKASIEGGSKTKRPRIAPVANQVDVAHPGLPLVPYGASSSQQGRASAAGPIKTKK